MSSMSRARMQERRVQVNMVAPEANTGYFDAHSARVLGFASHCMTRLVMYSFDGRSVSGSQYRSAAPSAGVDCKRR